VGRTGRVVAKGSARIVNKSLSGACVRVKTRIDAGSKLRIQSRWDEFSGRARYCRSDGQEYLVGIQRETGENAPAKKERVAPAVDGDLAYQNELLPLEEIYVAAGIVSPRRGYTIKKVMEMLRSEHLSALSKEMRRASVMMALDAAGISVDEVLRDAQVRLEALNSYEAEQKKLCEAEWARKAEEHAQLKEELEQVRARFMDRMKQTLDGIARDRARFGSWLTTMHEESQSITEAAELCLKVASPPAVASVAPAAAEAKEARIKVV
jgi:hypothetical protein